MQCAQSGLMSYPELVLTFSTTYWQISDVVCYLICVQLLQATLQPALPNSLMLFKQFLTYSVVCDARSVLCVYLLLSFWFSTYA